LVEPIIQLRYWPDVEEKQGNQNFEQDLIWKINKVENFASKSSIALFFFWVSLAFLD
jgi:hypothetical protein